MTKLQKRVAELARTGRSAEHIAQVLKTEGIKGASRPTVGRLLRKQLGPRRAGRRPAPTSPAPVKPAVITPPAHQDDRDDKQHALLRHNYATAGDAEGVRAAAVALRRFEDPDFGAWLDRGVPVFEALAESDIVVFDLLREPADIAALAQHAAAYFGFCGPSELAQAEADALRRAIALLESAIKIVKESKR